MVGARRRTGSQNELEQRRIDHTEYEADIPLRQIESRNEEAKGLLDEDHADTPLDDSSDDDELKWTRDEEARLVRKLDCLVMPLLIIAFFALQLDRGNIGNAVTDFFMRDVGITQSQFNNGNELLALGIVLWEIPSNFVLYRVGPSIWLSAQIVAWGLVATFQAFQHGSGAYFFTRFLLGSFESGFIPASLYTISRFYKRDETSKRFACFFIGNHFAQATSGLIAYGILHMRGVFGLGGWQWLFLIEGLFTVSIGALFISLFPKGVIDPSSVTGVRYFNARECHIMSARVLLDDPTKREQGENITRAELKHTFTNWRLIPHIIAAVLGLAPNATMGAYGPTLVESFGYGRLESNALMSIGLWMGLVLTIVWGTLADFTRRRGAVALLGMLIVWLSMLSSRLLVFSSNGRARFTALTFVVAFCGVWHPVNGSWMALNAQTSGERSITMAILIMSANSSGMIGSQLFQEDDGPLYVRGWTNIVLLVFVGIVAMVAANLQYLLLNMRLKSLGSLRRYQP